MYMIQNNNYNNGLNITVIVIDINIHNNSIGIFLGVFLTYVNEIVPMQKSLQI